MCKGRIERDLSTFRSGSPRVVDPAVVGRKVEGFAYKYLSMYVTVMLPLHCSDLRLGIAQSELSNQCYKNETLKYCNAIRIEKGGMHSVGSGVEKEQERDCFDGSR